jgi:hypothetical protein
VGRARKSSPLPREREGAFLGFGRIWFFLYLGGVKRKTLMVNYEDAIVKKLAKHWRAIQDLYEDLVDRKAIEDYEEREHAGTVSFTSSDDVLKMLAGMQKA